MSQPSVYEVITNHKSIRAYTGDPVKPADLDKILQAAIHAPSSINGQQWSIIRVTDQTIKDQLAELTGGQTWVATSAEFLVFVGDYYRANKAIEKHNETFVNIDSIESTMVASVDVGIALSNAINVAESLGYGTVAIGGVRYQPFKIIELLKLPQHVYPIVGMCIGVPAGEQAQKPRFPQSVMVHENVYNQDVDSAIDAYDRTIVNYMDERTKGQDVHSWSQGIAHFYKRVYHPDVYASLIQQGYKNEK